MSPQETLRRVALIGALGLVAIVALLLVGPIPQDPGYHDFADSRTFLGIPNFGNVVSNLPFVIAGIAGLGFVLNHRVGGEEAAFLDVAERRAWLVVFTGVLLTGFGSAWYHLQPTTGRLLWDRLPMTLVFMALSSAQVMERISMRAGAVLLGPLLLSGFASLLYWASTESRGAGDLRLYALVQYFPIAAIPLMIALFPPLYTGSWNLAGVAGCYLLAKGFEVLDAPVLRALGGLVSGHTLKHLASGLAVLWLLLMLSRRRPIGERRGG